MPARSDTLQIGVLISGGGTTLENLIRRIDEGRLLRVRIATVVSSRAAVRGVEIARAARLPVELLRPRDCGDEESFSEAMAAVLDAARVELVVMGGYLCLWRYPARFEARVLNIHPALLPQFGGKGMFGHRVHEAVLASGALESGCTVHLVDHQYDHGPIVAQARVPVLPGDTPDALASRVGEAEREIYPSVIQRVADEGLDWLRGIWSAGRP